MKYMCIYIKYIHIVLIISYIHICIIIKMQLCAQDENFLGGIPYLTLLVICFPLIMLLETD